MSQKNFDNTQEVIASAMSIIERINGLIAAEVRQLEEAKVELNEVKRARAENALAALIEVKLMSATHLGLLFKNEKDKIAFITAPLDEVLPPELFIIMANLTKHDRYGAIGLVLQRLDALKGDKSNDR